MFRRPWLLLMIVGLHLGAQDWPVEQFNAAFYDNQHLDGEPVLLREDVAIAQNWQFGSPDPLVPINGFSVRWRGIFHFEAGSHAFRATADDGVRIWVNERLILDNWQSNGIEVIEQVIHLGEGQHRVEVAYHDDTAAAVVNVSWAAYTPSNPCDTPENAWCASFYPSRDFSGTVTSNTLTAGSPQLQALAPEGFPTDGFSSRYRGSFLFEEGFFRFTTDSRDGVRLWVDDRMLINDWTGQPTKSNAFAIFLSSGYHEVRLENYRTWGNDAARLSWEKDVTPSNLNDQSPFGANVTAIDYWSTEWTLLDAMKSSGGWYTHNDNTWDTGEQEQLDVDASGWVRSLPAADDATVAYRSVIALLLNGTGGTYPAGRYLVLYDGAGTISYGFDASYNAALSRPGRHVLDVPTPGNGGIRLEITAVEAGNYPRNIRVVLDSSICASDPWRLCDNSICDGSGCRSLEDSLDTHTFHPAFLRDLRGYKSLRFMDLLRTNTSQLEEWSQRPKLTDVRWNQHDGAPLELAIDMANAAGADPWFNVPTRASDDFVAQMAQLILERLNPNRRIFLEYSNEIWNTAFNNGNWVEAKGLAEWPDAPNSNYTKRINYFGKRSAEIVRIFKEVFAEQAFRISGVMGGFSAVAWVGEQALTCPLATADGAAPCYEGMDGLAIAPYFGAYVGQTRFTDKMAAIIADPNGLDLLFQELSSGGVLYDPNDPEGERAPENGAMEIASRYIVDNAVVSKKYGLDLYAYEGGQHMVGVGAQFDNEELTNLLLAANRDPRMYDLYAQYLRSWRENGGTLFCHFLTVGAYGRYGSWGTKEYQAQTDAPKFKALLDFLMQYPCWWPGCAPPDAKLQLPMPIPF